MEANDTVTATLHKTARRLRIRPDSELTGNTSDPKNRS